MGLALQYVPRKILGVNDVPSFLGKAHLKNRVNGSVHGGLDASGGSMGPHSEYSHYNDGPDHRMRAPLKDAVPEMCGSPAQPLPHCAGIRG